VSLVLDIPNGPLDPLGFSSVEVVLHEASGDVVRSANLRADGRFELGRIEPSPGVAIEATLRNDSGAAVGYGRTADAAAVAGGTEIVVPVRRPIAYIAGTVSRDIGIDEAMLHWTESPATFSDLSIGANLDGTTQIGSAAAPPVMVLAAGPSLYMVTQATSDPTGTLTGPARVMPVSAADHKIDAALTGQMTGAVLDGAGSDDGSTLVIGTATQLFAVETASGAVHTLGAGSFARVAIVTADTGERAAIAIRNRGETTGPCATTAELWWAALPDGPAHLVATGGYTDLASDRGRAYYVDGCKAELGELTATATRMIRTLPATGRPTALAVSNGQAYVGVENQPATTSLLVASLVTSDTRTLWSETAQQVLDIAKLREVRRQLSSTSVTVGHLEVGAGGDYVALTTSAHSYGAALLSVRFPEMEIDTEELRVFDAATGGIVERYRSWCDGVILFDPALSEIHGWECASTPGQTAPDNEVYEHHIQSMAFLFGKK
jgi:hypothetical protein